MAGWIWTNCLNRAQSKDFTPVQLSVRLPAHVASQVRPFVSQERAGGAPIYGPMSREAVLYTSHYDAWVPTRMKGDNITTAPWIRHRQRRAAGSSTAMVSSASSARAILFCGRDRRRAGVIALNTLRSIRRAAGKDLVGLEL